MEKKLSTGLQKSLTLWITFFGKLFIKLSEKFVSYERIYNFAFYNSV